MGEPVDLSAIANAVEDEEAFVSFMRALAANRNAEEALEAKNASSPWGPGHLGWENGSIGAFLGAASAWAADSKKASPTADYEIPENPWTRCAQILLMGKHYE